MSNLNVQDLPGIEQLADGEQVKTRGGFRVYLGTLLPSSSLRKAQKDKKKRKAVARAINNALADLESQDRLMNMEIQ